MKQFALYESTFEEIVAELSSLNFLEKADLQKKSSQLFFQFLTVLGKETLDPFDVESELTTFFFYKIAFQLLHHKESVSEHSIQAFIQENTFFVANEKTMDTTNLVYNFYYLLLTKSDKTGLSPLEEALKEKKIILNKITTESTLTINGKCLPIFNEFISERVFVETDLDTDKDGKKDRIAVYIKRPITTHELEKFPAIYTANPYGFGCNEECYETPHNVECELNEQPFTNTIQPINRLYKNKKATNQQKPFISVNCEFPFPDLEAMGELPDYFLPRGFAKVVAGGIGTKDSDGFRSCGSVEETASTIAVIEWLTGERKAFSTRTGDLEVVANWCSGKVAMTGKSYLGTLAIAAATTGVKGLKTIVPEAAISNWYDYYRENGVLSSALGWQGDDADLLAEYCFSRRFECPMDPSIDQKFQQKLRTIRSQEDRKTALYNTFWDERNYLKNVSQIKASVFSIHGLNDWNVKPKQIGTFWQALQNYGITSRLLLHQGEHVYINQLESIDFYDILNLWLTQELYDYGHHATTHLPLVFVQSNSDINKWSTKNQWHEQTQKVNIALSDSVLQSDQQVEPTFPYFIDDKQTSGFIAEKNNYLEWQNHFVMDDARKDQLRMVLFQKNEPIRISGTATIQLSVALDRPTAIISAMLVDYGSSYRYLNEFDEKEAQLFLDPLVGSVPLINFKQEKQPSNYKILTRGHLNASATANNTCNHPLVPNKFYTHQLSLHPFDYWLPADHSLGLIIYGMDMEATQRPNIKTKYTVNLQNSSIDVPFYT